MSIVLPQMRGILARGVAGGTDPSFSNVLVLCHFDGTNGSTTFTNSATATGAPSFSNTGTSSLDTSIFQYGTASLYNNGGGVGNASMASQCNIGTGDFTWEYSIYTAFPSLTHIHGDYGGYAVNTSTSFGIYQSGGSFRFYFNGSDRITGGTVATTTFQCVAVSRVSGTTRMFIDGTQVGSNYTDGNTYTGTGRPIWIGRDQGAGANSIAHYDEWRVTIGVGRYSANYTPAAAAFPNS